MLFNTGCNEKCFLLNPEKKLAQIRLVVFEKKYTKMMSSSRRLESYSKTSNRLKDSFRSSEAETNFQPVNSFN